MQPGTSEIRDFKAFIPAGQLLLHKDRALYKALGRPAMGLWDLMSFSLVKLFRSAGAKYGGNMKGEGMVRGAMFVVGSREQGVLAAYLEEMGSELDFELLEGAMAKMQGAKEQRQQQAGGEATPAKL